jgi:hypothetical protein
MEMGFGEEEEMGGFVGCWWEGREVDGLKGREIGERGC